MNDVCKECFYGDHYKIHLEGEYVGCLRFSMLVEMQYCRLLCKDFAVQMSFETRNKIFRDVMERLNDEC